MTSTLVIASGLSNGLTRLGQKLYFFLGSDRLPLLGLRMALRGWSWFASSRPQLALPVVALSLSACQPMPVAPVRKIVVQQSWELNSGDFVAGFLITGGLGDITVDVNNTRLRAPFSGKVELAADGAHCIYFSTPEIPAYLFRFCGVKHPQLGAVSPGQAIGRGQQIHFATLRRLPDGTWAIVEPSNQVLEKTLHAPSRPSLF